MSEVIKSKPALGDVASWKSRAVKIGKGAANAPSNDTIIPAGYPVFESSVSGQEYDVFTKTGIAAAIVTTEGTVGTSVTKVAKKIGILLEPWKVSATQTKIKVAYAGNFDLDGVYAACGDLMPETDITRKMLVNSSGKIVFTEREGAVIYQ